MTTEPDPSEPPVWSQVLRALREARGITQEGFAAQLGVGRRTVQRWEQGTAVPGPVAEAALLTWCAERSLFRRYDQGALSGVAVSAGTIADSLVYTARYDRHGACEASGSAET